MSSVSPALVTAAPAAPAMPTVAASELVMAATVAVEGVVVVAAAVSVVVVAVRAVATVAEGESGSAVAPASKKGWRSACAAVMRFDTRRARQASSRSNASAGHCVPASLRATSLFSQPANQRCLRSRARASPLTVAPSL